MHNATLFLRNNVTRLQRIELRASGGSGNPVMRTPDGALHDVGSIFNLRFHLNMSHWNSLKDLSMSERRKRIRTDGQGRSSSDHLWPRPTTQVVRVENHGNMPLQIVELQVGENSCWSSTGFVADGCAALPVTLAPLQAWDIHVSYYSDCMSINELQSMRVVTTVGHFDA